MNNDILIILQLCFGLALFFSSVLRLGRTDTETIDEIRHSIFFVSLCSILLMSAPFLPILEPTVFTWPTYQTPLWVWLEVVCSFVCIQITTSRHWLFGQPRSYIKEELLRHRRERLEDFLSTLG